MNYHLDTNAVVAVLRSKPPAVREQLRAALGRGASIAVSSIVLYELWYGVARSERRRENGERLRTFFREKSASSRSTRQMRRQRAIFAPSWIQREHRSVPTTC